MENLELEELLEIAAALDHQIYKLKNGKVQNSITELSLKQTKSALEKIEKEIEKLK